MGRSDNNWFLGGFFCAGLVVLKTTILLGPPGTGKTTKLINLMSEYLAKGVKPEKIGFMSFTKQATEEARGRAMIRFGLKAEDLPYFRTLHSLCFSQLGMSPSRVMGRSHYRELSKVLGIEIGSPNYQDEGEALGLPKGDRLLFLSGLSRVRCEEPRRTWEEVGEDVDWFEFVQFRESLENYKRCYALYDFTDMLSTFEAAGSCPDLDVLFIDEAQDLSQLQWRIVRRLSEHAKETYLAGDDDQAIFRWGGADIDTFISYPGESKVLDQSYRIPAPVQDFACGFLRSIHNRRKKDFKATNHSGLVRYCENFEAIDISSGSWLILVRNGYQARPIEQACQIAGYHYESRGKGPAKGEALDAVRYYTRSQMGKDKTLTSDETATVNKYRSKRSPGGPWYEALDRLHPDDRDFFLSALRRGEKITGPPRIRISTIHGAKGGEADNVMLFTDMSGKTFEGYQKNPEDESRVFYVGATRAKRNLHVVLPQTQRFFEC